MTDYNISNKTKEIINKINENEHLHLTYEEMAGYIDTIERTRFQDRDTDNPARWEWTDEKEIDQVYEELMKMHHSAK